MYFLYEQTINISCEHCGYEAEQNIGFVKHHSQLACACGTTINLNADQYRQEITKVERSVADLEKTMKKIRK